MLIHKTGINHTSTAQKHIYDEGSKNNWNDSAVGGACVARIPPAIAGRPPSALGKKMQSFF